MAFESVMARSTKAPASTRRVRPPKESAALTRPRAGSAIRLPSPAVSGTSARRPRLTPAGAAAGLAASSAASRTP